MHSNREFMEIPKYSLIGTKLAQLLRFLTQSGGFGLGPRGTSREIGLNEKSRFPVIPSP
jgi:hypothetical protein